MSSIRSRPSARAPGAPRRAEDPAWRPPRARSAGPVVRQRLALAARLDKASHRVYVLLGDGELNEGQVWEAP